MSSATNMRAQPGHIFPSCYIFLQTAGVVHAAVAISAHPWSGGAEKAMSGLSPCPCRRERSEGRWLQQVASLALERLEGLAGRAAFLLGWCNSMYPTDKSQSCLVEYKSTLMVWALFSNQRNFVRKAFSQLSHFLRCSLLNSILILAINQACWKSFRRARNFWKPVILQKGK